MPRRGILPKATFIVVAERCPQILLRVLGLFAQQNLVVDHVEASALRESLRLTVSINDLDLHRSAIIAEKMRQQVMVRCVRVQHKQV